LALLLRNPNKTPILVTIYATRGTVLVFFSSRFVTRRCRVSSIDVLVIPHDILLADGLLHILASDKNLRAVSALEFGTRLPDPFDGLWVLVVDLEWTRVSIKKYLADLHARQLYPRVLVYGEDTSDEELLYFMSLGVLGWVHIASLRHELIPAIRHLAEDGIWMPERVVAKFVQRAITLQKIARLFRSQTSISRRELEVLAVVARGATNKEISSHLGITERTVKFHLRQLFSKLNVHNRKELAKHYRPDRDASLPPTQF
jgi:DNA-binding NarL/FixJ family response regulator